MNPIETILALLVAVAALAWVAARVGVAYPILLVLGGLAIGFVPGLPQVALNPDYVFVLFLPPLLYYAALLTTWRDFRANLRPISLLAVGLVIFTTVLVAAAAHYLIPGLSWAAAFVLGAIVSPPDAVAATAVTQRLRVPRRIVVILEGESLVNDATALVAYRFAIAAAAAGTFSLGGAGLEFVKVAVGGVAVGYAVGVAVAWIRQRLGDDSVESIVSLLTPYAAYLPAERMHVSGVLAVVTTGIYLSRRLPMISSARVRLRMYATWETLVFLLNGLIFILIGLQLRGILERLRADDQPLGQLIAYAAAISAVAIAVRMLWVFPATYLPRLLSRRLRERDPSPPVGNVFVVAWTGMRGIVSLAAALAVPLKIPGTETPFPGRDLILFITFGVILATLVVQGLTLPPVIRWFKLTEDGEEKDEESTARYLGALAWPLKWPRRGACVKTDGHE
jgi:CPA1 family monovalent cation:H+ antiporter